MQRIGLKAGKIAQTCNKPTESRNKREGHFAGKAWRYNVSRGRARSRRVRAGQDGHNGSLREHIPPGGWYGDPLGGGWGDEA